MDKQEFSNEILNLIEKFEGTFGTRFDMRNAIASSRGIPIDSQLPAKQDTYKESKPKIMVSLNLLSITDDIETGKDVSRFTFTIIKPNVVKNGKVAEIMSDITDAGFEVFIARKKLFNTSEAELFYEEHKGKSFYDELVSFMTSYPVYIMILKKENAVEDYRKLMGSLDEPESLRGKYADSVGENAVHGSDSIDAFKREAMMMTQF